MRLRPLLLVIGLVIAPASAPAQSVTTDCAPAWGRYSAAPGPKAFANGTKQGCGWQIKSDTYPNIAAIRAQALRQCAEKSGAAGGCRIIHQSN